MRLRPERNQLTPEIAAEDVRKLALVRAVASGPRHQVVTVENDRMHLDQRLAPSELRHGKVDEFENFGTAVLLEHHGLHLTRNQRHLQ